jgi:hypothetical protein
MIDELREQYVAIDARNFNWERTTRITRLLPASEVRPLASAPATEGQGPQKSVVGYAGGWSLLR